MKKFLLLAVLPLLLFSCSKTDEEFYDDGAPGSSTVKRVMVIYAINHSSLRYDFMDDSVEMLRAMASINSDEYQLLVYSTDSTEECSLYRAEKQKNGEYSLTSIRKYPRDVTSTHPERVREVLEYALTLYPSAEYDLTFWGHGMSWKPYFTGHEVTRGSMLYAYGGEYNPDYKSIDWTEIDELADAVPDHRFDTIWFDCCYMSGIEVIYEFRDKCNTFVGYPTEVWEYGLAYDQTLVHMLCDDSSPTDAAKSFFKYYNDKNEPVTVAVIDMNHIDELAEISRQILASGKERPETPGLLNYSRTRNSPFYDFGQLYRTTAQLNGAYDLAEKFCEIMDRAVVYHATSPYNFNYIDWNTDNVSGISSHYYMGTDSDDEKYYRTLDWYKYVFE